MNTSNSLLGNVNMKQIDYILSATRYGILPASIISGDWSEFHDPFKKHVPAMVDILRAKVANEAKNSDSHVGVLYNAFTTPSIVAEFKDMENYHFEHVHADSGGLQIVTADRVVTPEIRQEIYGRQAYADVAMCFDCIPLRSINTTTRIKGERSLTSNKRFVAEDFDSSAEQTASNVKEQIEAFRHLETKTKVIIIAQGNDANYMLRFFRTIASKLNEDDYKYIGGLAVADTCLGTGVLESIEMLKAAKLISDECHPAVLQQLHFLGVGSLHRIRPAIYLYASGYLDKYQKISYDSSSHAMSFDHGGAYIDGTKLKLGKHRTAHGEEYFRKCYRMFEPVMRNVCDEDFFIELFYGHSYHEQWTSQPLIKARAKSVNNPEVGIATILAKPMSTLFQIHGFSLSVDKMMKEKVPQRVHDKFAINYLKHLRQVKTNEDMNEWFETYSSGVKSNRIMVDRTNIIGNMLDKPVVDPKAKKVTIWKKHKSKHKPQSFRSFLR